jgi:hypothetical protein
MPDLFDFATPIAHTTDPATSHEAAARVTATGKRARHAAIVLTLVQRHKGETAVELWYDATDADRRELKEPQEVRRRLTDLADRGLVRQGLSRICRYRNTRMVTWEA